MEALLWIVVVAVAISAIVQYAPVIPGEIKNWVLVVVWVVVLLMVVKILLFGGALALP